MNTADWEFELSPDDQSNRTLVSNVHPRDWVNPEPASIYNLVVVGAGTAGLISAIGAASLGGKVALVERHLMGGDCLNVGCVPSKALIRSSRAAHQAANGQVFGLGSRKIDGSEFATVMARLRSVRAGISEHDSATRYAKMGIDVFLGEASFVDRHSVSVGGQTLRFRKAIIASGARAFSPPIPGLSGAGFLTNETLFNLVALPRRLAVIGGGPIGCEMAQAFRRLGSEVTIIELSRFLPREDPDASALLATVFKREGITVLLETKPLKVESAGPEKRITVQAPDGERVIEVDEILIGAGRRPNIDGMGLEAAGVEYDERFGIKVDDFLRSSNPGIYAAGDVCMAWKFTHAADAAARIAIQNALFKGRKRLSALTMPWCTYTDPEIAHVGMYESEAKAKGIETESFRVDMADNDRAVADGETEGFVKITLRKGSDKILGATIMAAHAGDLISELSVAMAGKVGLKALNNVIHPYPTQAEAIKRTASAWNKTRLTPSAARFLKWLLAKQL
ncbi:MAG: mercuric reductase [Spirochaetae bacterium HGW-Spirochaetae-7]|nr:MAG: mercuric reductase [Spirochaetae bacterium HGW-Spirochaetae-7]